MKYSMFFVLALMACSSNPEVVHLRTEKAKKKEVVKVDPNKTMTADVVGMTCEMGCGGSIRTKLKATGAVSRVQFDFVEGRKEQGMTVYFDEAKITQKQMMDILQTMNEQQFTLANVAIQSLEK
jgi:copper chaperone CopZ